MVFESTTKWLDLLVHCFRADLLSKKPEPNEDLDLDFWLNFDLYSSMILYMVNAYILIDENDFEASFDAFKAEVKANFASGDTDQRKQSYADTIIAPKLDLIKESHERLVRTLIKVWGSDTNKSFSYSKAINREFIELAYYCTREKQLELDYKSATKTAQQAAIAKEKLDLFFLSRQPGESHLYLLIKAALLTQECLKGYLAVWNPSVETPSAIALDNRTNVFNIMPLNQVKDWFMQLTLNKSSNNKPFLTPGQVDAFIERAFIGNSDLPLQTFNIAEGERASITKLFYLYYKNCTENYGIELTKQRKEKYVRLLTDNFTNYSYQTVFDNFNKSKNAPFIWSTTI